MNDSDLNVHFHPPRIVQTSGAVRLRDLELVRLTMLAHRMAVRLQKATKAGDPDALMRSLLLSRFDAPVGELRRQMDRCITRGKTELQRWIE